MPHTRKRRSPPGLKPRPPSVVLQRLRLDPLTGEVIMPELTSVRLRPRKRSSQTPKRKTKKRSSQTPKRKTKKRSSQKPKRKTNKKKRTVRRK